MREIYKKFFFAIMLLGAVMVVPACGGDDEGDDDGGGNGGGGSTPAVKMLPTRVYSSIMNTNEFTVEFDYDDKNRITEIYDNMSTNVASFKSETETKYTITYTGNTVSKIQMKSESTGSHLSGVHILDDLYEVSYSDNKVMIELVSSYNSLEVNGKGSALGVITLELDKNGRVTKRSEKWEDGRSSTGTFTYDEKGNTVEDAYSGKTVDGKNYTSGGKYEYDDKNGIFAAINAPHWFGQLPLPFFSYKGVNNVVKTTSSNSASPDPYVSTTTYKYNSDGYPTSYENESNMAGEVDSEWFVEYTTYTKVD